jgi:hypothetical protein
MSMIRRTSLVLLTAAAVLCAGCETNKVASPVVRFDRQTTNDVQPAQPAAAPTAAKR